MKKILVSLLTVILVLGMATMSVSAAKSPEANGIVSGIHAEDSTGKSFKFVFKKIDGKVIKEFADALKLLKEEYTKLKMSSPSEPTAL